MDLIKTNMVFIAGGTILSLFFIKYRMRRQTKRSIFLSFLRVSGFQLGHLNKKGVTITLIVSISLLRTIGANILYSLPIALFIWVVLYFIRNNLVVNRMQETADSKDSFNGKVRILENINGVMTIYSITPINDTHRELLNIICNAHVTSIAQDRYRKSIFYIKYKKGFEGKYRSLNKGSVERLEQILEDKKGKPRYVHTQETETEVVHEFTTKINPKRMVRDLLDIEHKLGIKKGYLTIEYDIGKFQFRIKKDVDKIYYVDDIIARAKKPLDMLLPFVLGVSNGSVVFKDLVDLKHLLIAGKTGSGKSCTFKCIIESLMYFNQNIAWYMLDFADSALVRYEKFTNVLYVESDRQSVTNALDSILREYERRKKLFREKHVENIKDYTPKLPYIILAIDEANGFKAEWNKKEFEPVEIKMKTILQRGRKYGIFTIHAAQQTNDNDYVKSWKTQFTRLAHLLEDTIDAQNITNNKEIQQLIPRLKTGEFYLLADSDAKIYKGCLSNGELYKVIKGVYTGVRKVNLKKSQSQPRTAKDKKAAIN